MPELQARCTDEEPNIQSPPSVTDLMAVAERQLGAFIAAITELFGSEHATLGAKDWIEEFAPVDNLPSSARDWWRITIAASVRFASRMIGLPVEPTGRTEDTVQ